LTKRLNQLVNHPNKHIMTDHAKETETREAILVAARNVFTEKGMNGARMQEIADRAGINKALLHYYFSNKETMFETIFQEAFSQFWPKVNEQLLANVAMRDFLKVVVGTYIDMLSQRPYLPIFILNELQNNPERLERMIKASGFNPLLLQKKVEAEIQAKRCQPFDAREIIINIISLSIFPFAAKPLIQRVWYNNSEEEYAQFLENRKTNLIRFIENAIFHE
jgi:TetR/AcrR family transcriptional regulator